MKDLLEVPTSSGKAKVLQLVQTGQQRIVLLELLAKANADVEHDVVFGDAMGQRGLRIIAQIGFSLRQQYRQKAPGCATPADVRACA